MNKEWPFSDPPNLAVYTSKAILEGKDWIHYVTHDLDDGSWQFHGYSGPTDEKDAKLVGLNTIVRIDASIKNLCDLPLGWCAWRETEQSEWQRMKNKDDEFHKYN